MIDYTITIGNIVEIVSIVLGGTAVLYTLKNDVKTLKRDFTAIQDEIKKLGDILVNLADIRGDIKTLSARIGMAEQDIREMKHGDGFIKGPRGVDRVYE